MSHTRNEKNGTWRRRLLMAARLLILALVTWGIGHAIHDARHEFARHQFSLGQIRPGWLVAAGALYAAGMLPMWWFWYQTLWALGQRPRAWDSVRAFFIGHLGKYVPGKALVVVLRTAFIRGAAVDTTIAAVSVFVETLTMMAVGAFLAGAIIALRFADQTVLHVLAWCLMLATGVPTLPPVFRRLVAWLRIPKANPRVTASLQGLTYPLMIRGWLACIIGWCLLGLSLYATLRAVPLGREVGSVWVQAPRLTASVTLAVVAGFLSLLPGGVGVRELVLDEFMTPEFGEMRALVTAVLLRSVWLVTELAVSAILYVGARKHDE